MHCKSNKTIYNVGYWLLVDVVIGSQKYKFKIQINDKFFESFEL